MINTMVSNIRSFVGLSSKRDKHVLEAIYQNPEKVNTVTRAFTRYQGYHGTIIERIGDEQLQRGKFDKKGWRIYVSDIKTAMRYAEMQTTRLEIDSNGKCVFVKCNTPVVLKISSKTKPMWNDCTPDEAGRGLGAYEYFPSDAEVQIDEVYEVKSNKE